VSMTKLILKEPVTLPVEAENIRPDRFDGLGQQEVAALPLLFGRRQVTIGDLFVVKGDGAEDIFIEGDLRHVKRIGEGMGSGRITIKGDAGMHLGAYMHGGEIAVHGNVQAWAGAHMSGGLIRVLGDAGPMLGAAYTGETRGMQGGIILVQGNAGPRVGERMRRGLIAIQGKVGEFAGARMIAGSIFAFGKLGARAGAGMKRGTIVALGELEDDLLPVFRYACSYNPTFLRYYLLRLREWEMPVTQEHIEGTLRRYTGDTTTLGKGEILVYDQR
jgi:formylmethanofuran dehydrogenase subunit C